MSKNGGKLALTIINPLTMNNNISKQEKKICNNNDIKEIKEESLNELLSNVLDTINTNSLNIFYPDSNNDFKKKIDSLNLKFYLETEKYLSNKNRLEKCQASLFIILFKQINIYIEEIERLNLLIIKRKYDPKNIIERTDEIIRKQNEFLIKEKIIKALKESKSNMEIKLLESIINENKLKKEIEKLKKENEILKNKNNDDDNIKNGIKINSQNKKNNTFLHKLTPQTFQSSTFKNLINDGNCLTLSCNNKKYDLGLVYKNNIENQRNDNNRKRNNSDNNKNNLNNSFIKYEKKGADKLLFKNYLKKKENIISNNKHKTAITNKQINILNNSKISKFKNINKRKKNNLNYKFKTGKENKNNTNINFVDINNKQTITTKSCNFDTYKIRPVKTEYKINELIKNIKIEIKIKIY